MLVGAWLLAQPEPLGAGPAQRCTVGRVCKGLLLGLLAGFGDMVLSKGGCRSLISHRWFSPSFLPILETLAGSCTVWLSYVVDMMSSPLRATPTFTGIAVSCPTSPQWLTTLLGLWPQSVAIAGSAWPLLQCPGPTSVGKKTTGSWCASCFLNHMDGQA